MKRYIFSIILSINREELITIVQTFLFYSLPYLIIFEENNKTLLVSCS